MTHEHNNEPPALRFKRSAPAKRDGITNHTFTFGGLTLLIQTRGGAGPKKMSAPGLIFVGDRAVGKSYDGMIRTAPELEQKILDAALPLLTEEEQASIMEPGWEGLRMERTMNALTRRAVAILRQQDRPEAHERTWKGLTITLGWAKIGDTWPGGFYPVRYYFASFLIDYGVRLTWEEALEHAREWAAALTPENAELLEKATAGAGVNMPPDELRTDASIVREFNSAA